MEAKTTKQHIWVSLAKTVPLIPMFSRGNGPGQICPLRFLLRAFRSGPSLAIAVLLLPESDGRHPVDECSTGHQPVSLPDC